MLVVIMVLTMNKHKNPNIFFLLHEHDPNCFSRLAGYLNVDVEDVNSSSSWASTRQTAGLRLCAAERLMNERGDKSAF